MASIWRPSLPTVVMGTGGVLLVIPVILYVGFGLTLAHLAFHLLIAGPFAVVPIYGGYWLERSRLSRCRLPRIGKWFFGVTIMFLAVNMILMISWSQGALDNIMWGLFAVAVGSAGGITIGLFEARAIEQARLAEQRRVRQEAARRRSKQFEEFAKIVSHDLRNPLNVAGGRLELAREERDSAHLAAVQDSLERMNEIIEDVLTLTWGGQEIEAGDLEEVRVGDVAQTSWEHIDAPEARLRVEDTPAVRANVGRFRRLLENLFRNAVEHGGATVTVRVGALSDGFFVEDDGPGIPPKSGDRVFEAGYSSGEEGTGLGLSIVQTITEAHGWDVSVTSGRDDGARFEFTGVQGSSRNDHYPPPVGNRGSVQSGRSAGATVGGSS